MPERPQPSSYTLDGCPPEGKGGDPQLNLLRNRTDRAEYATVSLDALTKLTWPKNVERLPMAEWSDSSRNFISQYAGIPIQVEGFITNLREGPPDPALCNFDGTSYLDWHLSFANDPYAERSQAVLAEVTPRVRQNHRWTMGAIHSSIMAEHARVRLSGWLFFDPDHAGDIGITRSTLWGINPVMQIEVLVNARWVPLDSISR